MLCLSQHPKKQKKEASLVTIWKTVLWERGTAHKTVLRENIMLDIGATNEKKKVYFILFYFSKCSKSSKEKQNGRLQQ